MKTTILFVLLFFICIYSLEKDSNNKQQKSIKPEYLNIDRLSDWKIIHKINKSGLYAFSFVEDSLLFSVPDDSLFAIKPSDDIFILYFNTSLLRNTGFILYGSHKLKKGYLIQTNSIYYNKTNLKYLSSNDILLRITEVVDPPIYPDIPYELRNNYLLFSSNNFSKPANVSVISQIEVNNRNHVLIADSLFDNYISLNGNIDKKHIADTLKIENRRFTNSKELAKYKWDGRIIYKKDQISEQNIVHFK